MGGRDFIWNWGEGLSLVDPCLLILILKRKKIKEEGNFFIIWGGRCLILQENSFKLSED